MVRKNVIVTGGGRGIGRELVRHLSSEGASVISASLEHSSAFIPDINKPAKEPLEVYLDVSNEEHVKQFFEGLDNQQWAADVLVNCAGIGVFRPLLDLTASDWTAVLATNLVGTFLCCREAITRMRLKGGGRIVNIGSISGSVPLLNNGAYGCSKAAVQMLTDIINVEYSQYQVFATCIVLGAVYTDAWNSRPEFSPSDMLAVSDVTETISSIVALPLTSRMDRLSLLPPKGVL